MQGNGGKTTLTPYLDAYTATSAEHFYSNGLGWVLRDAPPALGGGSCVAWLPDGRLMRAGGNPTPTTSTAQSYTTAYWDPAWIATSPLNVARGRAPCVALTDSRVVIGSGPDSAGPEAELFDPATNTWTVLPAPISKHVDQQPASFLDGRMMFIDTQPEIFDPSTSTFHAVGTAGDARTGAAVVRLNDGRILIAGGTGANAGTAALFDPVTETFAPAAPLLTPRSAASAAMLWLGEVLLSGGRSADGTHSLSETELYDPVQNTWSPGPPMLQPREDHGADRYMGDDVLVAGGNYFNGTVLTPLTGVVGSELVTAKCYPIPSCNGCGSIPDGCGGFLECWDCGGGSHCEQTPYSGNQCSGGECTPVTCAQLGDTCGTPYDGCGHVLNCGTCPAAQSCAGNVCVPDADVTATFDATIQAPSCALGRSCDSAALLDGRGPVGPEANAPNTIVGSCPDGTSGSYHATESIDRVKITAPYGGVLKGGVIARIDVTIWGYTYDRLDLFVTQMPDSSPPYWEYLTTLTPSSNGASVMSTLIQLPDAVIGRQAIRARLRNQSSTSGCGDLLTTDNDDLAFEVAYNSPDTYHPWGDVQYPPGDPYRAGPITLTSSTLDDRRVAAVQYSVSYYSSYEPPLVVGVGSTPPLFSLVWDPTALPDGTATLKGRVLDGAGNPRQMGETIMQIDNHPPVVEWWSPSQGEVVAGTYDFVAHVTDGYNQAYNAELLIDGAVVSSWASPHWNTASTADGLHVARLRATDYAGKVTLTDTRDIVVDNTAPVLAFLTPTNGQIIAGIVPIAAAVTDATDVYVQLYDGTVLVRILPPPSYATTWDTLFLAQGAHLLHLEGSDGAGHHTVTPAITVVVDNAPATSITAPSEGAIVSGTAVAVSAAASVPDPRTSVTGVELLVDDVVVASDTSSPYDFSWNSRTLLNGSHTLKSRATSSGSYVSTSAAVTITTDNDFTPPAVSVTAPVAAEVVQGTYLLAATASDASGVTQVAFYVDGVLKGTDTSAPYQLSWNSSTVSNGSHTVMARATDGWGQPGDSAPVAFTTNNDATPPSVSVTSPVAGALVRSAIALAATASDASGITQVEFFVDGVSRGTDTTSPYSIGWSSNSVPNGSHVVTARATDGAGLTNTSAPVSITVDNLPPSVMLLMPSGTGMQVRGTIPLIANASDANGINRVELTVDAPIVATDTTSPYSVTWNSATVTDGSHFVRARAFDNAGNQALSNTANITVDNTAPAVTLTAPASGALLRGVVVVNATASDTNGVTRVDFYDGAALISSDTTSPFSASWNTAGGADGAHTLTAVAFDPAGNSTTSAASNVTVDNTSPAVAVTAPAADSAARETITLAATATDASAITQVELLVDGVSAGVDTTAPYAVSWNSASVSDGSHSVVARATDAAGNTADSAGVSFSVDNTAPATAVTAPATGANLGQQSVTVTASASDNVAVVRVDFYDGAALIGSDTSSPYSVSWSTVGLSGARSLTSVAVDAAGNSTTSAAIAVTVAVAVTATYDATLRAPKCTALGVSCDSGATLILGRGTVGPEVNRPNTIAAACTDGNNGNFHTSESLDRLSVAAAGGAALLPGTVVTVSATVWATNSGDRLDIWRAPNANSPSWTLVATLTPTVFNAASVLQTSFTLPAGTLQAVRGSFRRNGSAVICPNGNNNDRDDLIFATQ